MDSESPALVKMEITHLIRFAETFAGIEVHLPVNSKFVKLNYSSDQFVEILRKLQQKDVTSVYISETDCGRVMEQIDAAMSASVFFDPKTKQEQKVETISVAMETVKGVIQQLGIDEKTIKLLRQINQRAMVLLNEAPTIYSFVNQYKKNCSEQFLLSILTNYVMSLTIDKFQWSSEQVKEKATLASIMCDMLLSKEDFLVLRDWEKNGGPPPEKILKHPAEVATLLKGKRYLIPLETITIIEQHHEAPDGSGYPHGILGSRINQLSAIFIVCQKFCELLYDSEFNFEKRTEILDQIRTKYGISKIFDKAITALTDVVH